MGEIDITFLGFALLPHDVDLIAGLELGVALVIEHLGDRQHAFGFGANIDHDVSRRKLQHGAFEHVIFADRFLALASEILQGGGEVVTGSGRFFVLRLGSCCWLGRDAVQGRALGGIRGMLSYFSGRGIQAMGGIIVEQD